MSEKVEHIVATFRGAVNIKHIATFRRLERNIWRQYLGARCGKRPGGRGKSRCEENLPISVLEMANFDQNRTFHFLGAMRPGRQWTAWSKTIVTINIHQHFGRSCTANISTYCQYFGVRLAICNIHISGDPKQLLCQALLVVECHFDKFVDGPNQCHT